MAVEAHHSNIFSQLISDRDFGKFQQNMNHGEFNLSGGVVPLINGESFAVDPLYAKANYLQKSESGLTYNVPPTSTKRLRDFQIRDSDAVKRRSIAFDSFLNAEFVSQIQNQQQSEIDNFLALQTEKLRTEIEARQQMQTRMFATTIQNAIAKKLKEKDNEIIRIRNLNFVLQEKVKSLCVENQIWRDIAQTNEANANNLRTNLDHVLSQLQTFPTTTASTAVENDVESSCGSCGDGEAVKAVSGGCKRCGEREASVLVLPCRHLCLCKVCGGSSLLQNCPVCNMVMNASVHVNMSS